MPYLLRGLSQVHVRQWDTCDGTLSIVARHGTQKAQHGMLTRVSEAVLNELAVSEAAIDRPRPGRFLTRQNSVNDDSVNSDYSL